jgi:cytidylate kinase
VTGSKRPIIIAVDGPAGSGKSTICSEVSRKIGWSYVNTGALYRGVGLLARDRGINLEDESAVGAMLGKLAGDIRWDYEKHQLFCGDENLTPRLGSAEAGNAASFIAKQQKVRQLLLPVQRNLALHAPKGAMVDGRDIGTVVFPDADLKIFMTANLEERARRRLLQLENKSGAAPSTNSPSGNNHSLSEVMEDIARRDSQDSKRGEAPLKKADDAVEFDTSAWSQTEVVDALIKIIRDRGLL